MEDDLIVVVNDSLYTNKQLEELLAPQTRIDRVLQSTRPDKLRVADLLATMISNQYKRSITVLRTSPVSTLPIIRYIIVTDQPQDWSALDACKDTLLYMLVPPQIGRYSPCAIPSYGRAVIDNLGDIKERGVVLREPRDEDYAEIGRTFAGIARLIDLTPDNAVCILLFEPDNLEAVEIMAAFTSQLEAQGRQLLFWKDYSPQKEDGPSYLGALSLNVEKPSQVQILRRPDPQVLPLLEEKKRCRLKLYCTKTGAGNDCGYWHPPNEKEHLRRYGSIKPRNVYPCSQHPRNSNSSREYPRCTYAHTPEELFCTFCEQTGHHYSRCPDAKTA